MTWTAMSVILEAHQPSRALQLVVAAATLKSLCEYGQRNEL